MNIKKNQFNSVNFASVENDSTWLAPFKFSDYIALVDEFSLTIKRIDRLGIYQFDDDIDQCFNPAIQLDYICHLLTSQDYFKTIQDGSLNMDVLILDPVASDWLHSYFKLLTGITGNTLIQLLIDIIQATKDDGYTGVKASDFFAVSIKEMSPTCAKRAKKYASIIHQFTK
ncbi:hypothetical protein [Furfurilactobacillus curtus]|uniref:Uncharacterized protein n=1 Tax=Furfurilactobacillus curtus TaxID=1746200 RepID=A0ABQ5JMW4_9LACO